MNNTNKAVEVVKNILAKMEQQANAADKAGSEAIDNDLGEDQQAELFARSTEKWEAYNRLKKAHAARFPGNPAFAINDGTIVPPVGLNGISRRIRRPSSVFLVPTPSQFRPFDACEPSPASVEPGHPEQGRRRSQGGHSEYRY